MLDIDNLSKEATYNLMRELLYVFNRGYMAIEDWVIKNHPEEVDTDSFRKVYEDFASYEAKRLSRALNITKQGIDELIKLIKHSHWVIFENIEVEKLTANSFKMRTLECSAQTATKKRGQPYYDCRQTGTMLRTGFLKSLNPDVKVRRLFVPCEPKPEGTPENISCEWLISIG